MNSNTHKIRVLLTLTAFIFFSLGYLRSYNKLAQQELEFNQLVAYSQMDSEPICSYTEYLHGPIKYIQWDCLRHWDTFNLSDSILAQRFSQDFLPKLCLVYLSHKNKTLPDSTLKTPQLLSLQPIPISHINHIEFRLPKPQLSTHSSQFATHNHPTIPKYELITLQ